MTETVAASTPFPERMHNKAVETNTRRAKAALEALAADVDELRKKLDEGALIFGSDARHLGEQTMRIGEHLSALETLRETREWDEAERDGE